MIACDNCGERVGYGCECGKSQDVSGSELTGLLYFVYAEKDPGCSCCQWSYAFSEHEKLADAQKEVEEYERDGYRVKIIKGIEL